MTIPVAATDSLLVAADGPAPTPPIDAPQDGARNSIEDPAILRVTSSTQSPVAGELVTFEIAVDNATGAAMTNARLNTFLPRNTSTLVPNVDDCGATATVSPVPGGEAENEFVQITLGTIPPGGSARCSMTVLYAPSLGNLFFDDFVLGPGNWDIGNTDGGAAEGFEPGWTSDSFGNARGFAGLDSASHDLTISRPFDVSDHTTLNFEHFFNLEENRDGGVVEASIDNGATWFDLQPFFGADYLDYNGVISANGGNPLSGRPAFTGNTTATSPFVPQQLIDLGTFAGEEMLLRFRIGTDDANDRPSGNFLPGEWGISRVHIYDGQPSHRFFIDLFSDQTTPGATSFAAFINLDVTSPRSTGVLDPMRPSRLLDTRSPNGEGGATADDESVDLGKRSAGEITNVRIAGRAAVPLDASAVVVNLTAIAPEANGFVTAYPCSESPPNAASLNFTTGVTIGNEIIAELSPKGRLCFLTSGVTHLTADVSASLPADSVINSLGPSRIVDTRADGKTIDNDFEGDGRLRSSQELVIEVAGRAGIPSSAQSVIINAAAVQPRQTGFLTVHPCLPETPLASNLNYATATTRSSQFVADLSASGTICVFTSSDTDLTIDVAGYVSPTDATAQVAPARVLDTRTTGETIDGRFNEGGRTEPDEVVRLSLAGRAGIPNDAAAALLNVTAVDPSVGGFVTVFACGHRERVSSLNYLASRNSGNDIVAKLTLGGDTCLYTSGATELVVDVVGYVT